jgi:hypothetical protein
MSFRWGTVHVRVQVRFCSSAEQLLQPGNDAFFVGRRKCGNIYTGVAKRDVSKRRFSFGCQYV